MCDLTSKIIYLKKFTIIFHSDGKEKDLYKNECFKLLFIFSCIHNIYLYRVTINYKTYVILVV